MIVLVDLKLIDDNPFQARSSYSPEAIRDLADNIASLRDARPDTLGLIHVPLARPANSSGKPLASLDISECRFQLAAGHCRLRAFRLLAEADHGSWWRMPLDVSELDDQAMADVAWSENQKRRDLTPIERARSLAAALARFEWTQEQIGKRWGLSQSAVANSVRLLDLPEWAVAAIHAGEITERHGRALLGLAGLNQWPSKPIIYRPDNSLRTAEEIEAEVRRTIDERSKQLSAAPWWSDFPGWAPSVFLVGVKGSCEGCSERASLLRQDRCTRPLCFEAKSRAYAREVQGPAAAARLYQQYAWRACHPAAYYVCSACHIRGEAGTLSHDWYQAADPGGGVVCADCWRLAQLPAPEPIPAGEPQKPAAPQPAPVMRPLSPQAGAPPRQEPAVRPATPVSAPRPTPEMRPAPAPAAPVPETRPVVVLNARIYPGSELSCRRVLLTIAEEGRPPAAMVATVYESMIDIIREKLGAYFAGHGDQPLPAPATAADETLYETEEEE